MVRKWSINFVRIAICEHYPLIFLLCTLLEMERATKGMILYFLKFYNARGTTYYFL
jgi:hypothetical protein